MFYPDELQSSPTSKHCNYPRVRHTSASSTPLESPPTVQTNGGTGGSSFKAANFELIKHQLTGLTPSPKDEPIAFPKTIPVTQAIETFEKDFSGDPLELKAIVAFLNRTHVRRAHPPPIEALFSDFAHEETTLSARPMENLVRPAGTLDQCRLLVVWNYPTERTNNPHWAIAADPTNPCTRLLLRKGLNPISQNIVWAENWWRRESTTERTKDGTAPYDSRAQTERDLHFEFLHKIIQAANPRVILLMGSKARDNYQIGLTQRHCAVAEFSVNTTKIFVEIEFGLVVRLVVCSFHTEALLQIDWNRPSVGLEMDAAVNLAVGLAGLEIPLNTTYFASIAKLKLQNRKEGWQCGRQTSPIRVINDMKSFENKGGGPLKFEQLPQMILQLYAKWRNKVEASKEEMEADLLPDYGSLVNGLHAIMTSKSIATRKLQAQERKELIMTIISESGGLLNEATVRYQLRKEEDKNRIEKIEMTVKTKKAVVEKAQEMVTTRQLVLARASKTNIHAAKDTSNDANEEGLASTLVYAETKLAYNIKQLDAAELDLAKRTVKLAKQASKEKPRDKGMAGKVAALKEQIMARQGTVAATSKHLKQVNESRRAKKLAQRRTQKDMTSPEGPTTTVDASEDNTMDGDVAMEEDNASVPPSTTSSNQQTLFTCTDCSRQYQTQKSLKRHRKVEHEGKRWFCPFPKCSIKNGWRDPTGLRKHMNTRHAGQVPPSGPSNATASSEL